MREVLWNKLIMLADDDSVTTTLISGDPELCKAFLFEAAVSFVRDGRHVVYFAPRIIETMPLIFHDRKDPSADSLRLIKFLYTSTYEALADQLLKLHTFEYPPSLIIVDELDEFAAFPEIRCCSRETHVARCCALMINAAINCSKALNVRTHVWGASFSNEAEMGIYRVYFENRWVVTAEPGDSGEDEGRKVRMKKEDGSKELELHRLDDAVLVLRRIWEVGVDEER